MKHIGNINGVSSLVLSRAGTDGPERVLVFRALKLGDMLCSVPALRALRAAFPEAEIDLLGLPWARSFMERYAAYVDGFHEFHGYPGLPETQPELGRFAQLIEQLKDRHYDLAVQLHGNGTVTNRLIASFGARQCAGFYQPGSFCPDPARFLPYPERGLEIERLLQMVQFLGIPAHGTELEFPIWERDRAALAACPDAARLRHGKYVCIHPGASVPERRWPLERFSEVARTLAARGLQIVLTGSSDEASLTAAIGRAVPNDVVNLAGQTELGSLAAVINDACLLICNDTGVSHLADALRVPSVVLSTGTNPERWAPSDRRLHHVLCRGTSIAVDEVLEHTGRFLERSCLREFQPLSPG